MTDTPEKSATAEDTSVPKDPVQPSPPKKSNLGGWLILAILLGISALLLALTYPYASRSTESEQADTRPPVVLIDAFVLHHVKRTELERDYSSFEQVMKESERFALDLQEILNDYRDAGIIVINKNAVFAAPDELDVTPVVAQRLNLTLPIN